MSGGATPPDAGRRDGPQPGPSGAAHGPGDNGDRDGGAKAPPIDEAARRIAAEGAALAGEAWGTFKAFRALMVADLALSRSAAGRVLVLGAIGTALGASAWLFGMGLLVVILRAAGLPWWGAIAIPTAISALGAGLCAWFGLRAFELTRFQATRRQLARLGIGDDPDTVERDPEHLP